jgi:hypothetical protein
MLVVGRTYCTHRSIILPQFSCLGPTAHNGLIGAGLGHATRSGGTFARLESARQQKVGIAVAVAAYPVRRVL